MAIAVRAARAIGIYDMRVEIQFDWAGLLAEHPQAEVLRTVNDYRRGRKTTLRCRRRDRESA